MLKRTPYFILSRHWCDGEKGIELRFWLRAESSRCISLADQESTCFVAQADLANWQPLWQKLNARVRIGERRFHSLGGTVVAPIYTKAFQLQTQWVKGGKKQGLRVWEDDINPADRFLMERFLFGSMQQEGESFKPAKSSPQFRVLSIEVATAADSSGANLGLRSVALVGEGLQQVVIVADDSVSDHSIADSRVKVVADLKACLELVIATINDYDPDCIIGWDLIDSDLRVLQNHCDRVGLKFAIGRQGTVAYWRSQQGGRNRFHIEIEGRCVVDGPGALRSAAWTFDDYSLDTVARVLLVRDDQLGEREDSTPTNGTVGCPDSGSLASAKLANPQLVHDIFEAASIWDFLIERAHLTGLQIDRVGSSAATFNSLYLPRLHRKGYVAPSVGEQSLQVSSPGGYVFDSKPGLYNHILVLDFKSLYPAIIRTFLIDPLGLHLGLSAPQSATVAGFLEARFHRTEHLLPALTSQLWASREQAKGIGNKPMSHAIKIIMNSFYGLLGSEFFRFFDPRLASSITLRGHQVLQRSREFISAQGHSVIYGDTDSLFVHAATVADPEALGKELVVQLNQWWREQIRRQFNLESYLELEFETHYEKFVMPTVRGADKGSKKRYAGWIRTTDGYQTIFKGMEAVRSDWTPLAKDFQQTLYTKFFAEEDYIDFIQQTTSRLKSGTLDDQLVYRRHLRRPLEHYTKQKPPHVQAARLRQLSNPYWRGKVIDYVKTMNGWQPSDSTDAPLDYHHYLFKQLAPVAQTLLKFVDKDFVALIDDQLRLF